MARPRGGLEQFYFKPAIPSKGLRPSINFEAHITGLTDTSSPQWNENFDMGRADPVMLYGGMSRIINVGFIVVAATSAEHSENYLNMRELGNLTYPIYKNGEGFNGPHVFFSIGLHLSGYGVLTSVDYTWNPEHPWVGNPRRPLLTDVSINIKVLGDPAGDRPEYLNGNYNYFGD